MRNLCHVSARIAIALAAILLVGAPCPGAGEVPLAADRDDHPDSSRGRHRHHDAQARRDRRAGAWPEGGDHQQARGCGDGRCHRAGGRQERRLHHRRAVELTAHDDAAPDHGALWPRRLRADLAVELSAARLLRQARLPREGLARNSSSCCARTRASTRMAATASAAPCTWPAERIFTKLGVSGNARIIPFNSAGETLQNFLGGHVDIYGGSFPPIMPYPEGQSMRCVLVTSAERSFVAPDVMALTDFGIAAEATSVWGGLIAPKGTPPERIAVLEKAFSEAARSQEYRDYMRQLGTDAVGSDAAQFKVLLDNEYNAMAQVVKNLGLVRK